MSDLLWFIAPYEFSPVVAACFALSTSAYVYGLTRIRGKGGSVSRIDTATYLFAVGLMYVALQTHFDYWAQHMFFIHRIQHLVLHHVGPFLVILAAPGPVLSAALPRSPQGRPLAPSWLAALVRCAWRFVQHPITASLLFVGLIALWLIPIVHVYAMLSVGLYNAMNWGMVVDGLLFWGVILDPRVPGRTKARRYATRIAMLAAIMPPQIGLGAWIALCRHDLYPIYAECGRLWPITPMTDQIVGGIVTWIPAAMMSVVGMLVVLRRILREEAKADWQSLDVALAIER